MLICIEICIMIWMCSATFHLLLSITLPLFKIYLMLLNNKLEFFSPKNQVISHSCHCVGGGNGHINRKFFALYTDQFKVSLPFIKKHFFLVQAFILINILLVCYLYFYCRLSKYFEYKGRMSLKKKNQWSNPSLRTQAPFHWRLP